MKMEEKDGQEENKNFGYLVSPEVLHPSLYHVKENFKGKTRAPPLLKIHENHRAEGWHFKD